MKKTIIACTIILLYFWTWFSGKAYHEKEVSDSAQISYKKAIKIHDKLKEVSREYSQKEPEDIYEIIHKEGSSSGVEWCFPIFPGVLIADSYKIIGPLWGSGGIKIVLFYGFGTKEVLTINGWIS